MNPEENKKTDEAAIQQAADEQSSQSAPNGTEPKDPAVKPEDVASEAKPIVAPQVPSSDGTQPSSSPAPTTPQANEQVSNPPQEQQTALSKVFTQSQVNDLVGKARIEGRESAIKALCDKYGVENSEMLDEIFGNGEKFGELSGQNSSMTKSLAELQSENALLKSHVDPSRFEDVKAILEHNNLEVTPENITLMAESHPEWIGSSVESESDSIKPILTPEMAQKAAQQDARSAAQASSSPVTKVKVMGATPSNSNPESDERKKASQLLGVNL